MQLHRFVCWWCAPQLRKHQTMFLVKLLDPVPSWYFDGYTARARSKSALRVRVCDHRVNANHPDCGSEFLADGKDLVAVQYGYKNN